MSSFELILNLCWAHQFDGQGSSGARRFDVQSSFWAHRFDGRSQPWARRLIWAAWVDVQSSFWAHWFDGQIGQGKLQAWTLRFWLVSCVSMNLTDFGKPQTGSFVTGSFRQALATRSSSARQTFVSTVFVFAIARQTPAKRLSKTTRLESTCLGLPEDWLFPAASLRLK